MLGQKQRLHLESYIMYLLLDDNIRADHRQKFQDWIKQTEAKDASDLSFKAHVCVADMAESLAENGSLLYAQALAWDCKNNQG